MTQQVQQLDKPELVTRKMVGGKIPEDLYWDFKKAQADRKENAQEALEHAIMLYLDAVK